MTQGLNLPWVKPLKALNRKEGKRFPGGLPNGGRIKGTFPKP